MARSNWSPKCLNEETRHSHGHLEKNLQQMTIWTGDFYFQGVVLVVNFFVFFKLIFLPLLLL